MDYWIFQGNPAGYRLDEYLASRTLVRWPVRQGRDMVREGDSVFFWRSASTGMGGVVAVGRVASALRMERDDAPEFEIAPRLRRVEPRVEVELIEVRLTPEAGMIPRTMLMEHPKLRMLKILRQPTSTNYRLDLPEAEALALLWEGLRRPLRAPEVMKRTALGGPPV